MVERGYIDLIIGYLPEQAGLEPGACSVLNYIEQKCAAEDRVEL